MVEKKIIGYNKFFSKYTVRNLNLIKNNYIE